MGIRMSSGTRVMVAKELGKLCAYLRNVLFVVYHRLVKSMYLLEGDYLLKI